MNWQTERRLDEVSARLNDLRLSPDAQVCDPQAFDELLLCVVEIIDALKNEPTPVFADARGIGGHGFA